MAEDGMLVNFALSEDTFKAKPILKGGKWRDRYVAKRRQKYQNAPKSVNVKDTDGNPGDDHEIRWAAEKAQKRQKLSHNHDAPHRHKPTLKGSQEVVSSLFSYNPTARLPVVEIAEDMASTEPSNAPLMDGLDTFTSTGVCNTLAAHLLNKLNLKAPTAIQKAALSQLIKEDSDAFIQAETGSGKTLAYLLPIVQRIMELSKSEQRSTATNGAEKIHRDSGLFAVVLAPTRELCKQISTVLDSLLRCAHWIVAGTVIGGEKKKSEKARLRKGLNILVATPGRLADHLQHTEALDVSNVRWLVLDEGDRLMELGFEAEITGIVRTIEERSKAARNPRPGLPTRRTTILCSATMKTNVQRLGEISLKDAIHIKADPSDPDHEMAKEEPESFSAPAQLKQSYAIVPAKQRLVTLAALLKRTFARKGSVMKALVFMSCADSVDFHFEVFTQKLEGDKSEVIDSEKESDDFNKPSSKQSPPTVAFSPSLSTPSNPNLTIHKLHGSLPQIIRTSTLSSFTRSSDPTILFCTDVASRGLDVPNIDLIIEYDPAFSSDEHLHRIGRTARAGKEGRAVLFLMPGPEEGYIEILKKSNSKDGVPRPLTRHTTEEILQKGFSFSTNSVSTSDSTAKAGPSPEHWSDAATTFQLAIEQSILSSPPLQDLARRAYISHVRAYATHIAKERSIFDVKELQLGHLAKAFGLRERPGQFGRGVDGGTKRRGNVGGGGTARGDHLVGAKESRGWRDDDGDGQGMTDQQEAAKKMRAKIREVGGGGAGEFNIG